MPPNKSEKPSHRVLASPDDAANALLEAAKSGDQKAALAIFGPESKEIIFSGDAVQDQATVNAFVARIGRAPKCQRGAGDIAGLDEAYS